MIIPILSLLGLTCQYSRIFNVDFTKSIPVVLSSLIIFLYGFAIFDLLYVATNIAYIFGIGCVLFNAVFYRKDWLTKVSEYWPEIGVFSLLIIAYGYYTHNAVFASWDDLDEIDACIHDKSCKVKYYPFVPAIVMNKANKS